MPCKVACQSISLLILLCARIKAELCDYGCRCLYTNCLRPQYLLLVDTNAGTSQAYAPLILRMTKNLLRCRLTSLGLVQR